MTQGWDPVDSIGRPYGPPIEELITAETLARAYGAEQHGFVVADHWLTGGSSAYMLPPARVLEAVRRGALLSSSPDCLGVADVGGTTGLVFRYAMSSGPTVVVPAAYFREILPAVLAGHGCDRPQVISVDTPAVRHDFDRLFELGTRQPYVRTERIDMGAAAREGAVSSAFARLDGMSYAPLAPGARAWNGDGVPYRSVAAALAGLDRRATQAMTPSAPGPQAVVRGAQSSMRGAQSSMRGAQGGERVAVDSASRLASATSVVASSPATPPPALSVMRPIGGRRMRIVE